MAQLVRRKECAIEILYDRYSRVVYPLILRITGQAGSAQEIVQEVFLQLWRKADAYEPGRGAVEPWLLTIARYRALSSAGSMSNCLENHCCSLCFRRTSGRNRSILQNRADTCKGELARLPRHLCEIEPGRVGYLAAFRDRLHSSSCIAPTPQSLWHRRAPGLGGVPRMPRDGMNAVGLAAALFGSVLDVCGPFYFAHSSAHQGCGHGNRKPNH
jgi:sigma-70-like protein